MIFRAIEFAAKVHSGQFRKATKIPYITHVLGVCKILAEHNCDESLQVAGILHDTVEDTYASLEDIKILFGTEIARIVEGCSETSKIKDGGRFEAPWKERKEHTIEFLQNEADLPILLVASADKLDNIRSMHHDLERLGGDLWKRFNAGPSEQKWYYQSLANVLKIRTEEFGSPLVEIVAEMEKEINKIFE